MGAFKKHFKMVDQTKKKSQQYTKDAQVHSILKHLNSVHFNLVDSTFLSSSNNVNKTDHGIILYHHRKISHKNIGTKQFSNKLDIKERAETHFEVK